MHLFCRITCLELKKINGLSFKLFVFLFSIFTCIDNYLRYNKGLFSNAPSMIGNLGISLLLVQFYLLYLSATLISQEFRYKTSTVVFSNPFSRSYIVFSKLCSLFIISTCLACLNVLTGEIFNLIINNSAFEIKEVVFITLKLVAVYNLFAFCVSSVGIIASILTSNRIISLLACFGVFQVLGDLVSQSLERFNEHIASITKNMFFYIAPKGFGELSYSPLESANILAVSCILYIIGIILLNRKDLT